MLRRVASRFLFADSTRQILHFKRQLSRAYSTTDGKESSGDHDHHKHNHANPDTTHFGYQNVRVEEKEKLVGQVFASVADKYDIMNDLMSIGVHRIWKKHFMDVLSPSGDTQLLDVAGGTGDIAFRFLDAARLQSSEGSTADSVYSAKVTVADINPSMLKVGQQRAQQLGYDSHGEMEWICANAEALPFQDEQFDAYTIAFGIRNCTNLDRVLSEAYRVLRPGGRFLCLEFGRVQTQLPLVQQLYDGFSFNVIPELGQLIANDRHSYQYLVESIRKFPPQPVFARMIREAGFSGVQWEDLTFGVAAIHSGWKLPLAEEDIDDTQPPSSSGKTE